MDTDLPTGQLPEAKITEASFCEWLGRAVPGDALEYFRGSLAGGASSRSRTLVETERSQLGYRSPSRAVGGRARAGSPSSAPAWTRGYELPRHCAPRADGWN